MHLQRYRLKIINVSACMCQILTWAQAARRVWLVGLALLLMSCSHTSPSPDASLSWRTWFNADARMLEQGQAALRNGELALAVERFSKVAGSTTADSAMVNAAHYGLACSRLAMVSSSAQLAEALAAWRTWQQEPPSAARADENPRLLTPFITNTLPALMASSAAQAPAEPLPPVQPAELDALRQQLRDNLERIRKQEQEIRTLETRLGQKNQLLKGFEDQIRGFEERLRGFEDQVRVLENQLEGLEELDRRMEQKKKGINTP